MLTFVFLYLSDCGVSYKRLSSAANEGVPTEPLVYNIISDKWTTTYQPMSAPKRTVVPDPKDPIPEGDDHKVNGTAIGGGVAGGLMGIAVIALLVVRRRRQKQDQRHGRPKEFKAVPQYDPAWASMNSTCTGSVLDEYSQFKTVQKHDSSIHLEYTSKSNPQGTPNSPQSASPYPHPYSIPRLPPVISFRPNLSVKTSTHPQDHIQQCQQERDWNQDDFLVQNNPQYDPSNVSSPLRSPQGIGEPVFFPSERDLEEEIETLEAQLQRLHAMRNV